MDNRRNRRKRLLALLGVAGAVGSFAFSSAYFSSQDQTGVADLTAGTISISTTETGSWTGNYDNLLPGASVTSDISVANDGSAALVYAITANASSQTSGFLGALTLKIADGACSSADFTSPLVNATMDDLGVVRGDTQPYTQDGDIYLASGASQDLCVQVHFVDSGEPQNELQAATASLGLTFDATQIDDAGSISN